MRQWLGSVLVALWVLPAGPVIADELILFGAGSLREALTEAAATFAARSGVAVRTSFGFSGLMRERIEKGEPADLFASADMGHPMKLLAEGRALQVAMFTRNTLCAVATPAAGLTADNLLDKLLDPALVLGVFPPKDDPVGDYSRALFHRAEGLVQGAEARLVGKARIVSAALARSPVPAGQDYTPSLLRDGVIDLHLTYCSTARLRLLKALPDLVIVETPEPLRVGPEYGLAILKGARPTAAELALFILSVDGQAILKRYGFAPVGLPQGS